MSASDAAADERRIDESTAADSDRCRAISVRYSRRCRRRALAGIPYCPDHASLFDADSMRGD